MKKIPELNIGAEMLFDMQLSSTKTHIMMSAVELKLFDHTSEPAAAAEIAAAVGTLSENTEHFLNGLTAIGLLRKNEGKFVNSEIADTFLVNGKETYLGGYLMMNEQFNFQNRQQVTKLLQSGPPKIQADGGMDGEFFAVYTESMKRFACSGSAQVTAAALSCLPEFKGFKKMLDLGGAHGLDCIAAVQNNPAMKGVVFDKPSVIEIVKKIITEYGMDEQVGVLGGDYTTDPIGSDYDLVLAKGTLNFVGTVVGSVVEKIHNSLNSGGVFVSINADLIPDAAKAAGFTDIEVKPFYFPMGGRLDMVIGRKK